MKRAQKYIKRSYTVLTIRRSLEAPFFSIMLMSRCSIRSLSESMAVCMVAMLVLTSSTSCLVFASIIDICVLVSPSRCVSFMRLSPEFRSTWLLMAISCNKKL